MGAEILEEWSRSSRLTSFEVICTRSSGDFIRSKDI